MESPAYYLTAAGFATLTLISYYALAVMFKHAVAKSDWSNERKHNWMRRFTVAITGWALFLLAVSATGFFADFSGFPPRIIIVLSIPLIATLIFTFSSGLRELLPLIPARSLLRLQVFRVFVELLLWACFVQNLLPVQMTFEGRNFDIVSGILGPLVAYYFSHSRKVMVAYNLVGLVLLINIVATAILSLPTPFRVFMNEPSNTLVAHPPFILLPGLLVPLAYGLHFLSFRQLSLLKK